MLELTDLSANSQKQELPSLKPDTMQPGETVSRSPLDKPLHLLTEDDISQLTREDCRRFLKDKGVPLSPSLTPSLPLRLSQSHL